MPSHERSSFLRPRFDLGLVERAAAWPSLFARAGFGTDLTQGLALTASTLPLSLFLASLAGAPASSGIFSAALGSAICALLGGARIGLSGPGLATALVTSSILARHGLDGLGLVLILAGGLQVAAGVLGLGRFVRFLPLSLLRGLVVGIGLAILLRQLPSMLGAPIEPQAGILAQLDGLGAQLARLDPAIAMIGIGSAALAIVNLKRPHFPAPLLAIVLATLVSQVFRIELPTLHEGESFPWPQLPVIPAHGFAQLFGSALELWSTMTLATAIHTVALEELDAPRASRTDPDQELIAQGFATMALSLLRGLPATQFVARSVIGVRLGVVSPRPALIQAFLTLALGLAAWPFLHLVPLASLSAVAVCAGVPLLARAPLRSVGHVSRLELVLGAITVAVVLLAGLMTGVLVSLSLAFALVAMKMARTRALVHRSRDAGAPHQISFSGPITFLAADEIEKLHLALTRLDLEPGLVIDLRNVVALDVNGAIGIVGALDTWRERGGKVALLGPSMRVRRRILRADETPRSSPKGLVAGGLKELVAPNDREVDAILGKSSTHLARPRLLAGLTRFREEKRGHYDSLFAQLADGQQPHTMFITCADSRIEPSLLMGSHPGDLFIVRAIGALVSPAESAVMPQEGAAVEYGVGVLGVRTIIVCGHSKCGAISALKSAHLPAELATLHTWAHHAASAAGEVESFETADEAARAVTVRQIDNLLSYPLVRAKHEAGELQLHAWFYDLGEVELFEWDSARRAFSMLGTEPAFPSLPPQAAANDGE